MSARLTRRRVLAGLGALPLVAIVAACSDDIEPVALASEPDGVEISTVTANAEAAPAPAATPQPVIVAAGEQRRVLMSGTPQQTPLYIYGTGQAGPIVMVLGGVHGNEPGGWLAAEQVVARTRPATGALLVLPRANTQAVALFERTTPALGDLNRLYPGNVDSPLPMERMASEIVETLREFRVSVVVDMHESWAFYRDRPQNGTAFLGQTVATAPAEPAISLARSVVDQVNQRVLAAREEFSFREFPPGRLPEPNSALPFDTSGNPQAAVSGGSRSSLGLPNHIPGLISLLVEMGQQQSLDRRVALHVDVLQQVMRNVGIATS